MDKPARAARRRAGINCGQVTMGVEGLNMMEVTVKVRPWWESRLCLALVVLATMLPLLYPPVPPLVDLLGHMGRYRVELDLDHSPFLQRYYDLSLGGDRQPRRRLADHPAWASCSAWSRR